MSYQFDTILGAGRDGSVSLAEQQKGFDAGTAAQKAAFQASVSGDVLNFSALASIISPTPGQRARVVAPVMSGGLPYTNWFYDGAVWRLAGVQDLFVDASPSVGIASTAEQILKQVTVDPGVLLALRYFTIRTVVAKSGITDAMSVFRIRCGANGTISDLTLLADTALTAANRQRANELPLFATSPTVVRHYTNGFGGGTAQSLTSQAYPAQATVASMLSAVKISFSAQMAGTTDTPVAASVIISGA